MYDNEYYGAPNDYRNYLSHHGIKGQKWGVMHGPPYPLGSHTSAMIKKGKKVAANAKKTYDKKIKPKVNDLAKKGSDFYEKNMPEKGKQVINKAAKKTKEVYEVNKEMVKKGISNYKSNYDSTKNDLKAKSVLSGTGSNKENAKVELKNKDLKSWEQNWYEDGYVVENPDGFSEGTTLRHLNNKKNSNGDYRFGTDYEEEYSITSGDSLLTFTKYHRIKNDNNPSDKQLASIQKSYLKNQSKIEKGILNNIADFIVNDPYGWNTKEGMDSMGLKTKNDVIKALRNDKTGSETAFTVHLYPDGYGKEGGSNYVTGEFWSGDATLYGYHAIVQEFIFDPKTGEYKANPKGISLQG